MTLRLVILIVLLGVSAGAAYAQAAAPQLAAFIESERAREGVPGVAVAVIRDHRIAWTQGFGVANTLTRDRVTSDTAFPAASNGKPIAAWLLVQLAAQGTIDLRKPVREQAPVDLPDTPDHRRITPWHLLTHTSGLGNFLRDTDRDLDVEPGRRFAYSGVGFMVLQELLEHKTRLPLDAHARQALLEPLGMTRTWYGARPTSAASIAAPHVDLAFAVIPFGAVALPLFIAALLLSLAYAWITRGRWRIRFIVLTAGPLAVVLTAFVLHQLSGSWPLTLWLTAVPAAIAIAAIAALALAVHIAGPDGSRKAWAALAALAVCTAAGFALRDVRLPLPTETGPANAASSLYASAPDLARFLIELAKPTLGNIAATNEMTTAQQRIDDVASWGLGIGVERHAKGRDLWQWGSNPGAKSLMVISPETGDGVVILTNGEAGGGFTRRIAARILGREGCWRAGCRE